MAKQLFSNNATTTLSAAITNVATSISVVTGKGALFASPSGGDYELLTITDGTNYEIVKCTARSTDTLTVTRAQESTSARAWSSGATIAGYITKGTLEQLRSQGAGTNAVAIGTSASASGSVSIAIGNGSTANSAQGTAVGDNATGSSYASALGSNASASGSGSVAIGYGSSATQQSATSIGDSAVSIGSGAVSVGRKSRSGSAIAWQASTAYTVGDVVKSTTTDDFFVCQTEGTSGGSEPTWPTWYGDTATDNDITWYYVESGNDYSSAISVGYAAHATQIYAVSIGDHAVCAAKSIGIGALTRSGNSSIAIGYNAYCDASDSIAIGEWSNIINGAGVGNLAIGPYATVTGGNDNSTAIGNNGVNRIGATHTMVGMSLVRKDASETDEHLHFAGQETIVFSSVVDLKTTADDVATITIPTGSTFYCNEIGVVVTAANTVTGQPNVSFGVTGNTTSILGSTATTKSAVKGRDIFTPLVKDGVNSLTASVKTGATATTLSGRFYWRGMLVEDQ